MTSTLTTRPDELTENEQHLIASLIHNPRVSSRDVAGLQEEGVAEVRRTLFRVTRYLALQPATLRPIIVVQPKQAPTLPASLAELEKEVHDLYARLEELLEVVPTVLADRINACFENAVEAYGDTHRLLRWVDQAKNLIKSIEMNPMFRSSTPPSVDLDALKERDKKLDERATAKAAAQRAEKDKKNGKKPKGKKK